MRKNYAIKSRISMIIAVKQKKAVILLQGQENKMN
jgi:hypothetical protein